MTVCRPRAGECSEERSPASSRFCDWHRTSYAPMVQQIEAAHRRKITPVPVLGPWVQCADCGPVPEWYADTATRCRACSSEARHGRRISRIYGIGPKAYAELLEAQEGRCAICRCRPRTKRFAVDHGHRNGQVRGLLCSRCNHLLLGGGQDSLKILESAVEYLRRAR
jgi:hypothetical protein